jgi:hypothetical protein
MFKIVLTAVAVLNMTIPVFAEDVDKAGENFEKHKSEMLENIDKKIKAGQDHRSCVAATKDRAGLKECMEKMRDTRMEFKEERMESRKERLDERMKKMEERKKK